MSRLCRRLLHSVARSSSSSSSTTRKHVTVAMSGGVDSSVSAALLRDAGCQVKGVYMQNWDLQDETGVCTADQDWRDVQDVCRKLDIPCERINFTREYWGQVFETFVESYASGQTPNPDVMCNRYIKFGALYRRLFEQQQPGHTDFLATGHYARTAPPGQSRTQLQRALDADKDQTYFLCTVNGDILHRAMFPVGHLHKGEVKQLARRYGLERIADKKESMGICFVGRRKRFGDFLDGYVVQQPGAFVGPNGAVLGQHDGFAKYTVGQRARIHSQLEPLFVSGRDPARNIVYVVPGRDHPELFSDQLTCNAINWIHPEEEDIALSQPVLVQIRHRQSPIGASISKSDDGSYTVRFERPVRGVAAGQVAAIYAQDICLGGGTISRAARAQHGLSVVEKKDTLLAV